MKKWWVKLLLGVLFILLVLFTWFIGAGSQSQDELARYRKQLIAAGERLDVDAFIPPRVDSDKNGAALFDQACWYIAPRGASFLSTNPPVPMEIVAPAKARVLWQQDGIISVRSSRYSSNSWEALELDLANQNAAVDLLQQAAAYPDFDFGIDYHQSSISTSQLTKLRQAATLLWSRTILDLRHGDAAAAVTNLHTLLAIADASKNEPLFGLQSARIYFMQMAIATQWELLQVTNLTDEQLSGLQKNWLDLEFVKSAEKTFEMSRCLIDAQMKTTRVGGASYSYSPAAGPSVSFSGGWDDFRRFVLSVKTGAGDTLWRNSWCYDDELRMLEGYSLIVETARQTQTNGYFKDALAERERKIVTLGLNRTNLNSLRTKLGGSLLEFDVVRSIRSFASMLDRMLAADAWRQCTVAAIALKRYELRHGTLPKDLSALVPQFLSAVPNDSADGRPLRYRLNGDGTFLLYSIGVDGVDDGGDATAVPSSVFYVSWETTRDWVWPQPATATEVQHYYDHPPK